jgi:hypothetical protein
VFTFRADLRHDLAGTEADKAETFDDSGGGKGKPPSPL